MKKILSLPPIELIHISTHVASRCKDWYDLEKQLRPYNAESFPSARPGWVVLCMTPLPYLEESFITPFLSSKTAIRMQALYMNLQFFVPFGYFEAQQEKFLSPLPRRERTKLKKLFKRFPAFILSPILSDVFNMDMADKLDKPATS